MFSTIRAPHGLIGWWRYSNLNGRLLEGLATVLIVSVAGAIVCAGRWHLVAFVLCGIVTALIAAVLVVGAIRAERARRYGCW